MLDVLVSRNLAFNAITGGTWDYQGLACTSGSDASALDLATCRRWRSTTAQALVVVGLAGKPLNTDRDHCVCVLFAGSAG